MKAKDFDKFWRYEKKYIVQLLKAIKKEICDDYIQGEDTLPSIDITISINEKCTSWSYQTGDNSFSGGCYGDLYWGIGTLYRRSNTEELAKELLSDLSNQINFE